jgi:hypothetical protein
MEVDMVEQFSVAVACAFVIASGLIGLGFVWGWKAAKNDGEVSDAKVNRILAERRALR